ncbi:cyclase family protein [Chloroflexota bacterium]
MSKELSRNLPTYSELSPIGSNGEHHSWGVFSAEDEIGMINFLTPERVKRAAKLVRKGKVFNLCLPLNLPDPHITPVRHPYQHKILRFGKNVRDDRLDNFWMQYSSHWDALGHMRYEEFGFYGGLQDDEVERGKLGIDRWVEHGMAGRGILLDVGHYMEECQVPFGADEALNIGPQDLEAVAQREGVQFESGDILLIRTGWMKHYLELDQAGREEFALALQSRLVSPGLDGTREMAAFLWDHRVAAVAADNIAVESLPGDLYPHFPLHNLALCLLGMPLGELWDLEALAADCVQDGVYECMVISIPLNIPGGIGSPANAIAIK